jgi:hypothetical protein
MDVIFLHSDHQHVSATHMTIFRVVRTIYKYNQNVSKSFHMSGRNMLVTTIQNITYIEPEYICLFINTLRI